MDYIKKRLIYYFYGFEGYRDNRAIKIHLNCLKYYSHIFDEALFVISLDDVDNKELIHSIQKDIIECGFKNITFKVHKNNGYCEAQVYYNEIIERLSQLDGLTFFGHTKGISNYHNYNINSIDDWILGMYYLNLEYINEIETNLCHDIARFYGTFLQAIGPKTNKNQIVYSGTFYWINAPMLYNDIKTGEVELPSTYFHRGYAEGIPGNSFPWGEGKFLASHNRRILGRYDEYTQSDEAIKILLGDEYEEYNNFKNEILKNV